MSKFLPLLLFLLSCGGGKTLHVVGILQWTEEIEAYRETYRGVLDGLEEGGFSEAKNLKIIYINDSMKARALPRHGRLWENSKGGHDEVYSL